MTSTKSLFLLILLCFAGGRLLSQTAEIRGELKAWHTIRLLFDGPSCSETDFAPNPFLDYRLTVTFSNGSKTYRVPGFFAADGNAAETGATTGTKWQVNFVPDEAGVWRYTVSFCSGREIAVKDDATAATTLAPDGLTGMLNIAPADKNDPGFLAKGRLEYTGRHFLQFRQTGEYFLKNGSDSPENFLAYADFDQTYRHGEKPIIREGEANPKENIHSYAAHVGDWKAGDPTWQGGKGKGLIGALNYLASQGVNAQYMLTLNILGDGKDVWPYADYNERYRFDCSKLDQWEIVFSHMDRLGMMIHVVLQETENECLLDGGYTDVQRKLYLRELVARFGHHLAVTWNLGEENGPAGWTPVGQSDRMRKDMANYLKAVNPYPNFVVIHTHSDDENQDKIINPLLGFVSLDGLSMQIGSPEKINRRISHFVHESGKTTKNWVVTLDELGPAHRGIMPDAFDPGHDTVRAEALWGSLMGGAAGAEWYFGYRYPDNDLNCEDFRSRENWWKQTRIAHDFFVENLPFAEMKPANKLVDRPDAFCLAKAGEVYAIYQRTAQPTKIELPEGTYSVGWFNPRSGGKLQDGTVKTQNGGGKVSLGMPAVNDGKDWVAVIRRTGN